MSPEVSIACKYESFNTLIKINDPELLLEVFMSQLVPDYGEKIQLEIFNRKGFEWEKLLKNGYSTANFNEDRQFVLEHKINPDDTNTWFYQSSQNGWYCAYKPLSSKQYAMFISTGSEEDIIDEEYIQLLFGFYCHQLCSLEGTYRDNLTGLYNRKAFDLRMTSLLNKKHPARRKNMSHPSVYVMLDIDHFKEINDTHGHLYGDETLSIIAKIMTDSFREYDLLFRYGGEEFAAVLMDIDDEMCKQVLNRFKSKVEHYDFPKQDRITISIGYTDFDRKLTVEQLIDQADKALYYGKEHGRNAIHQYQSLVEQKLIEAV